MSFTSPKVHCGDYDDLVVIFDFDGVLVDSVATLREVYFDFLKSFGRVGSEAEFRRLNGPKLPEIVALLKRWHGLPASREELLAVYEQRIREHYPHVALSDGVRDALGLLDALGIPTALATASSRDEVEKVLSREGLLDAFAFTITGDEVERAKPHSDIYLRVKAFFPERRCIVLEDSENGLKAALGAGLETVFFDPKKIGTALPVLASLYGFGRFPGLLEEICTNCFTLTSCAEAEIRIVPAPWPPDEATEARISQVWEHESHRRKLSDSNILCYAGHRMAYGKLQVDAFISKYRYFLACFEDQSIPMLVSPLGVSGLILDTEGKTLAARRGEVTEYAGLLELVPSGGIDVANVTAGRGDFISQILDELEEEAGIGRLAVNRVSAYCLIRDATHGVVDLGCVIELKASFGDIFSGSEGPEYGHFQVLSPAFPTTGDDWVPGSGALLRNRSVALS